MSTGGPFPTVSRLSYAKRLPSDLNAASKFLGRRESPERTLSAFGDNWDRLCEVKRKYDPRCLFRSTFWPLDADGNPMEPQMHEPGSPEMSARAVV